MPTRCLMADTGSKAHDGFRPACKWRKRGGQLKVGRVFRMPREHVRRVPEMVCMCMVEAWEEWFSEKRTANGPQTRPRKCGYTTWLPVGVRRPPSHPPLPSKQHAVSCQLRYCTSSQFFPIEPYYLQYMYRGGGSMQECDKQHTAFSHMLLVTAVSG
jgi:hypothetical protein